jgi:hypothetical protein
MLRSLAPLLLCATMLSAIPLAAQTARPPSAQEAGNYPLDVAVTFQPMRGNSITAQSFWAWGGSVQVHGQFYRGLGVVADVAGTHTAAIDNTGVGLDMVTAVFGPRYTWALPRSKCAVYAQALAGEANAFHGVFPTAAGATSSSNSTALLVGGGFNLALTPRIALRALEAGWLRTGLPNSTTGMQNNLRLGAGIVVRFR